MLIEMGGLAFLITTGMNSPHPPFCRPMADDGVRRSARIVQESAPDDNPPPEPATASQTSTSTVGNLPGIVSYQYSTRHSYFPVPVPDGHATVLVLVVSYTYTVPVTIGVRSRKYS